MHTGGTTSEIEVKIHITNLAHKAIIPKSVYINDWGISRKEIVLTASAICGAKTEH
jgi:hypothetical protein